MKNYFEIILEDKIYSQRTPNSKIIEFSLDGIKQNTYDELPKNIKEIINLTKEIEKNPEYFFKYKETDNNIIIKNINYNPNIKKYIKIPEFINEKPVTTISNSSIFNGHLEQIQLPETITCIEPMAFQNCKDLKYINIPPNIKIIPHHCFKNCTSLNNVDLNNVTQIEQYAFLNCESLTKINLSKIENLDEKNEIFAFCSKLREVILPNNLTKISDRLFCGCEMLDNIILPDTVEIIDEAAFKNCSNLTNIKFSKNLKKILNYAFDECKKIQFFNAPDNLEIIGHAAFSRTGLEEVYLNKKIKSIGEFVFVGCLNLKSIHIYDKTMLPENSILPQYKETIKIIQQKNNEINEERE